MKPLAKWMMPVLFAGLASGWSGALLADTGLEYNQVRFQVQAAEAVTNDRMQVLLVVQDEDSEPARLADRINKTMAWALQQTRGQNTVQVHTGGYSTQPVYSKERITAWRSSQELKLESGDFAKLGSLIGVLQERLQLRAVNFSVADETRAVVEQRLIDTALERFKQRAEQVRANIGSKEYRIVEINIITHDAPMQPLPMMRAEAMSMAVKAPSFEGGDSEVQVGVNGVVQLQ